MKIIKVKAILEKVPHNVLYFGMVTQDVRIDVRNYVQHLVTDIVYVQINVPVWATSTTK